jgi:hypothetical protein
LHGKYEDFSSGPIVKGIEAIDTIRIGNILKKGLT